MKVKNIVESFYNFFESYKDMQELLVRESISYFFYLDDMTHTSSDSVLIQESIQYVLESHDLLRW